MIIDDRNPSGICFQRQDNLVDHFTKDFHIKRITEKKAVKIFIEGIKTRILAEYLRMRKSQPADIPLCDCNQSVINIDPADPVK